MSSHLTCIPKEQLKLVSGGLEFANPYLNAGFIAIELVHSIFIVRELTNYLGDIWNSKPIEEGDYFTQFFSNIYNYVAIR